MPLMARAPRALGLLLLSFLAHATLGFREGDFIQTARRAQFQKKRTNWHDLLGHHCPRFGEGRVVRPQAGCPPAASAGCCPRL